MAPQFSQLNNAKRFAKSLAPAAPSSNRSPIVVVKAALREAVSLVNREALHRRTSEGIMFQFNRYAVCSRVQHHTTHRVCAHTSSFLFAFFFLASSVSLPSSFHPGCVLGFGTLVFIPVFIPCSTATPSRWTCGRLTTDCARSSRRHWQTKTRSTLHASSAAPTDFPTLHAFRTSPSRRSTSCSTCPTRAWHHHRRHHRVCRACAKHRTGCHSNLVCPNPGRLPMGCGTRPLEKGKASGQGGGAVRHRISISADDKHTYHESHESIPKAICCCCCSVESCCNTNKT